MHHKDEQKRAQICSSLVSTDMIKNKYIFPINSDRARESETVMLLLALGHHCLLLWLHLPKFSELSSLWSLGDHDATNITFELNCLTLKHFKLVPF
jgi:hypothetical protein